MYFVGDLHGSFSHMLYTLAKLAKRNINVVQVGDFGIGFTSQENSFKNLSLINEAFKEWDSKLYVMRGNHDDPAYFKGELRDKVNSTFSNIYFVQDYEVLEIEGKKLVFVGGGVSIDRIYRSTTSTPSYWKDEVVVYSDKHIAHIIDNYDEIDIFVTHSAPMWCHPTGLDAPIVRDYCSMDENLKQDLTDEREILGDIFDELNSKFKFKYHFYGHFHTNYRRKIADTFHVLLGIGDWLNLDKLIELDQKESNTKDENKEQTEIKD